MVLNNPEPWNFQRHFSWTSDISRCYDNWGDGSSWGSTCI